MEMNLSARAEIMGGNPKISSTRQVQNLNVRQT